MRKRPRADQERLDLLKQEEFMLTFCETVEARSSSITALQSHDPFLGKECLSGQVVFETQIAQGS
jgi:hypothetical protein